MSGFLREGKLPSCTESGSDIICAYQAPLCALSEACERCQGFHPADMLGCWSILLG